MGVAISGPRKLGPSICRTLLVVLGVDSLLIEFIIIMDYYNVVGGL